MRMNENRPRNNNNVILSREALLGSAFLALWICVVHASEDELDGPMRLTTRLRLTSSTPAARDAQCDGQQGLPPSRKETRLEDVFREVEAAMSCQSVPGLAVTVVSNKEVVTRGYGYADVAARRRVDEHTKFLLGSASKAFTATLVGILLAENENRFPAKWDTKIVDILGKGFRLSEDVRTRLVTIRDVLSHRVALLPYKMALQMGLDSRHSMQDYCSRMQYVEKIGQFRGRFEYSNIMFVVAGCAAEKIGNASFERLIKEKIFGPLGMHDSELIQDSYQRNFSGLSRMYFRNDSSKEILPIDMKILRSAEMLLPAGGVISTAKDMARWMRFHLNQGRNDEGRQLLPKSYWHDMHARQMVSPKSHRDIERPWFPVTSTFSVFGMGWRIGHYRGLGQSEHPGRLAAFESKVRLIHGDRIGIFTVTNGPAYVTVDLQSAIHFLLADAFLNEPPWLNRSTVCSFPKPWSAFVPKFTLAAPKSPDNEYRPAVERLAINSTEWLERAHELYAGQYGHSLYGNFTVTYKSDEGRLRFTFGLIGEGTLGFVEKFTWLLELTGALEHMRWTNYYKASTYHMMFQDQDPETEQFLTVICIALEPKSPVVFRRNLKWDGSHLLPVPLASHSDDYTDILDLTPSKAPISNSKTFEFSLCFVFITCILKRNY